MTIEARLRFDRTDFALRVDFAVPATGVTTLFGPSGCAFIISGYAQAKSVALLS